MKIYKKETKLRSRKRKELKIKWKRTQIFPVTLLGMKFRIIDDLNASLT